MPAKYRLLRDMPGLLSGAIFEHRDWDKSRPDMGNRANGCLILSWINGSCQQGWVGESFILPGQLRSDKSWFEELNESKRDEIIKAIDKKLRELGI